MNKRYKGALTVEASMIMPIVVWMAMFFYYLIKLLEFQQVLYDAMYDTADALSDYAYTKEIDDNTFVSVNIKRLVDEKIDTSMIFGGYIGLNVAESSVLEEGNRIVIVTNYIGKIPFVPEKIYTIKQTSRLYTDAFLGKEFLSDAENEYDNTIVYVTKTGRVYHKKRDCSYLKLKIKEVSFKELEKERNESGAKYYKCEVCLKKGTQKDKIYVCKYGTRYHKTIVCRELKRLVREKKMYEVRENMKGCSKCVGD